MGPTKKMCTLFLEVKKVPKHYFRNCSNYPKSSDSEIIGGLYFSVSLKNKYLKKCLLTGLPPKVPYQTLNKVGVF